MDYGQLYNENYYKTSCGIISYLDSDKWTPFYEGIADKIVEDIHPSTVLDVGCAVGYLVAALRDRGIEAYGIDVSEYAISHAREDIKHYCRVCSALESLPSDLPQRYDLVVTIEVAEHLYEEDGKTFVKNICIYSDNILFSSTPDDITEKTHFNVQQPEYWAKRFAENGFFKELTYDASYVSQQAIKFEKTKIGITHIVENYERSLRIAESKIILLNEANPKPLSSIYLDIGNGFTENKAIKLDGALQNGQFNVFNKKIDLPQGVKSIRFDPVEGAVCVVKNLEVVTNGGILKWTAIDGIFVDDFIIFTNTDPKFLIDLEEKPTEWVKIRADLFIFNNVNVIPLLDKLNQILVLRQSLIQKDQAIQEILIQKDQAIQEKQEVLIQKDKEIQEILIQKDQAIQEKQEVLIQKDKEKQEVLIQKGQVIKKIVNQYKKNLQEASEKVATLSEELDHYKTHYFAAINQRTDLTNQLQTINGMYQSISNSACWKVTKPLRYLLDVIKKLLKSTRTTALFYKGLKYLKHYGVKATIEKMQFRKKQQNTAKNYELKNAFTDADRKEQENTTFSKRIKFSILVPLYNTPVKFLREMIDSVQKQTYKNWELCLADGSDEEHDEVQKICKAIAKKDSRIHYKKLEKNLGISGNTNQCIDMSQGDYIALLDHDDLLHPAALFENMKVICDKNADFIYTDENTFSQTPDDAYCPHFKPDFAIDNLRANNYICHFTVFSRKLHERVGGFRAECDGSQDYDMVLRLTEQAEQIIHIPKILYYWRAHQNSVASDVSAKPYVIEAAKKALTDHLERVGLRGEVCNSSVISTYKLNYQIKGMPLISILIPNKDHIDDLVTCLSSILEKSTYSNYEIIIIENNSTQKATFDYYNSLKKNDKIQVVFWEKEFNYSAINNFGFKYAKGDFILLLNNDVEIITPNWLEEMLMFAQRKDVGAVGVKLYYPDDTVQHAGICIGMLTLAGHYHRNFSRSHPGYMARLSYAQDVSAVTGACMMLSRKVYEEVNGLDETFQIAFNDVDLCMHIRKAGYLIVFTPYAELYHYESKSRGLEDTPEKRQRFEGEVLRFQKRWAKELEQGDPFYNPNLTLNREDFSIK